jgi:hypothetical protein
MDFRKTIMAGVAACSVLTVLYGSDSSLQNIGSSFDRWVFECRPDGKKLRMPKIDANSYRSYLLKVKGDTIHMMHDDPDKETAYQGIFFTRYPGLTASGIVVAEWTAAVLKPADNPAMPVFQAVLSAGNNDGQVWYPFAVKLSPQGVSTPAGLFKQPMPDNEFHKFRAAIDPESGEFVLVMDGNIIQQGTLPKAKKAQKPMLAIGDCSGGIAGQAALKYFKIGIASKPPETVVGLGEIPVQWAFECLPVDGKIPMSGIDANSYRKDLLTADAQGIHMIHDDTDPAVKYQGIFIGGHPRLCGRGILIAEWEAAVQKAAADKNTAVFNVNMAPADSSGKAGYQTNFLLAPARITTKLGVVTMAFPAGEFHRFRMALNPENGDCSLWMDGKVLQQGKVRPVKTPGRQVIAFGDCSGAVAGQAVIRYFRIGKYIPEK